MRIAHLFQLRSRQVYLTFSVAIVIGASSAVLAPLYSQDAVQEPSPAEPMATKEPTAEEPVSQPPASESPQVEPPIAEVPQVEPPQVEPPTAPAEPPAPDTKKEGGQETTSTPSPQETHESTATVATVQQSAETKATIDDEFRTKTNDRLDQIEKSLSEIAKSLSELRSGKTTPVEVTSDTAAQPQTSATAKPLPEKFVLDPAWLSEIPWRSLGPANMGGRITDLAVHEQDTSLWWVATASGGLLKTKNHGVTVEHQFDREATVSIGAIATDPQNKEIVWVGTGEANPRNSVSYGDGVYKSTDGGATWKNMGLKESFQIGKILVHPKNSDIVYVGALGRLYGPNPERGVFKTSDGGNSWEKVLFVDEQSGCIDLIMHPENPDIIIAAMWDRLRDGFDSWPGSVPKPDGIDGYDPIRKWGPGGGLYKTTDGGKSWKKLSQGLPSSMTGRIGLDWQSKSPHVIYAIIDCEDIGKGPSPFDAFLGLVTKDENERTVAFQVYPDSPAEKAGLKVGDVIQSVDQQAVTTFDQILDVLRKKKVGEKLSVAVLRGEESLTIEATLTGRPGTQQAQPAAVWLGLNAESREGKIVLSQVVENGPAAKAGLQVGDVVHKLNDQDISDFTAVTQQIRGMTSGASVKLTVLRGEETKELTIVLEERPGQRPRQPEVSNSYLGIQGEDATGGGTILTVITEGGPAAKAGLKAQDVVTKVDGNDLAGYEAFTEQIRSRQPGDKMKLVVRRANTTMEVEVTVGDRRESQTSSRPYTYSYFGQSPNVQDQQGSKGQEYGGIYKSTDGGETWQRVNSLNTRPMYFSVVRVDPSNEQKVYVLGVNQFQSTNGGTTFTTDFGRGIHADAHDLWINPNDGRHMVVGCDGGFYVSFDYGQNWDHINTAAVGQFYHVAISLRQPYWVIGGLQDNGSWAGPAISKSGGAINEDWLSIGGGDGFVCRVDPNDPDLFYYESQGGVMGRRNLRTGESAQIRPRRVEGTTYRFNWNTPFILSQHNSKIFYCGGDYVFRSLDRGDNLRPISPEITLTKRGSATALAESPRDAEVLYVGTDDGALWVTRNGGRDWKPIHKNLELAEPRWIATIEPSRFEDGRVYVCVDAHRSNDDQPYIFVSEDFGETFTPLHKDLPWGSTRCLREDIVNENILYLGTEFALWLSLDRGQSWTKFNQKLPTVAVHDLAQHPVNGEIVLATHGRSLWAFDATPLRSLTQVNTKTDIAFFKPNDVVRWRSEPNRGRTNRRFAAQNPPTGAAFWYTLPEKTDQVVVRIESVEGQRLAELPASGEPGLHRVGWNLMRTISPPRQGAGSPQGAAAGRPPRVEDATGANPAASGENAPAGGARSRPGARRQPPVGERSAGSAPPESQASEVADRTSQEAERESEGEETSSTPSESTESTAPRRGPPGQLGGAGTPGGRAAQFAGGGFGRGGQGVMQPVPNGSYRVTLVVQGKEVQSHSVSIERDPTLAASAVSDEEYELSLMFSEEEDDAEDDSASLLGRKPKVEENAAVDR